MKTDARKLYEHKLSAYVDGELSVDERRAVDAHLAASPDSAAQVTDFRASSALLRLNMETQADEQDWSNFSNQVMARLTPERLSAWQRIQVGVTEMFRYQRTAFVAVGAVAGAAALAVAVTLQLAGPAGYANPKMEITRVDVEEGVRIKPVVFETSSGDQVVWVGGPAKRRDGGKRDGDEEREEELNIKSPAPMKEGEF